MQKLLEQMQPHSKLYSAMETRDHSKNEASPKSQMSRGNKIAIGG